MLSIQHISIALKEGTYCLENITDADQLMRAGLPTWHFGPNILMSMQEGSCTASLHEDNSSRLAGEDSRSKESLREGWREGGGKGGREGGGREGRRQGGRAEENGGGTRRRREEGKAEKEGERRQGGEGGYHSDMTRRSEDGRATTRTLLAGLAVL